MSSPPAFGLPDRVETVLFDAGGVLLDLDYGYLRRLIEARQFQATEAALARAEAAARSEMDRRIDDRGRPSERWREYFHFILGTVGVPATAHDEIVDTLWEAHHRVGLWTVAISGAPSVVQQLRELGFRTGVVSNAEGQVARDLDEAGYRGQLETVIDSHVVGVEKPDPEIFRLALRALDMPAETAVHVGDVPSIDVKGARAAGITPILLDRHGLHPDVDALWIRSLKELPPLIDIR